MEKTIIKFVIVFSLLSCLLFPAYAQNNSLSSYEQKRYDLANNTLASMGEEDPSIALTFALILSQKVKQDGPFADFMSEVYFVEEFIEAIGLGVSFMGVDDLVGYVQKKSFMQIYNMWKQERNALDKMRTISDIEREKVRKKKMKGPRKGTVDHLISMLNKEFVKWAEKGKYEKTIDYENRLNKKGLDCYDSLCIDLLTDMWALSEYAQITQEGYDADREVYSFLLTFGDSISGKKQILGECSLPIHDAKNFYITKDKLFLTEVQVVDGLIAPREIGIYYNNKSTMHKFLFKEIPNATPLKISFNDIGFNYSGITDSLKNHSFTMDDYYKKGEQVYELQIKAKSKLEELEKQYSILYDKYNKTINESHKHNSKVSHGVYNHHKERDTFPTWFNNYLIRNDWDGFSLCGDNYDKVLSLPFSTAKRTYAKNPQLYKKELNDFLQKIEIAYKKIAEIDTEIDTEINSNMTNFLLSIDYNTRSIGKIKKVSIEDSLLTFIVSKEKQIQSVLHKNQLKLSNGEIYNGELKDNVFSSKDGRIKLLNRNIEGGIILIVDYEYYELSPKVQRKLSKHGYFNQQ